MKKDIPKLKEGFILNEIFNNCILAAFRTRNASSPVYKKNLTPKEILDVDCLKKELKAKLLTWEKCDTDDAHCEKILELTNYISQKYGHILHENKMRIGITQKLVNLYLKYLWVIGKGEMPIHCPIDGIVKENIYEQSTESKKPELVNWTKLDSIDEYTAYLIAIMNIVENEKSKFQNYSIAEWELKVWELKSKVVE